MGAEVDRIHYVHLGKMAVVKASSKHKALTDFQSQPWWASAGIGWTPPHKLQAPALEKELD